MVPELSCDTPITKKGLVSNIAKVFDVLGWFSPTIIQVKILLQRVWEERVGWDSYVPEEIQLIWNQWRQELPSLANKCFRRCYFPRDISIVTRQLHGFCDASEKAYSGVVYL